MNLRQLEVFWAIMRTGSVTGAARLLAVSQPAISKTLRHTEDQAGMKFFLRKGGKLIPTEEAEHLYEAVETVFDNVQNVRRALVDLRDGLSGRLQIAVVPSMAHLMRNPVTAFLRKRPEVDLTLKVLSTTQVLSRVARQQVDMGVVYGPLVDTELYAVPLSRLPVQCIVPRDHPLAGRREVGPAELAASKIISFSQTSAWGQDIALSAAKTGTPWHVSIECNHTGVALELAAQGLGVALTVLPWGDFRLPPDLVNLRFTPEVTFEAYAICRQRPHSRLLEAMLLHLREISAQVPK